MKLNANESLQCTDYETVCDKSFFGFFTPGGSSQSSSYDVTVWYDVTVRYDVTICCDVTTRTLGASTGRKVAESFSVTSFRNQCNVSFRLR